jgi:hypothetical protein
LSGFEKNTVPTNRGDRRALSCCSQPALLALRQSQKTLQDINKQENQVAAEVSKKREQQQQFSEALQRQGQAARSQALLNTYRPGFMQGGVYHYHYHIYP